MSQAQLVPLSTLSTLTVPDSRYFFDHQFKLPGEEKPHVHPYYEIYVNVTGNVSFLVNNTLYPICAGDAVVTRPGDVHLCVYNAASTHECFCFWLSCPEDSPLIRFTQSTEFSNHIRFEDAARQRLLRLLYWLETAEKKQREPARTCCIFELLTLFSESGEQQPESRPAPALPAEMQEILDYINAEFPRIRCVADLARHTHISASTLNRRFRTYLKLSPHKLLEALKLSYAQKLLREGCTVTEVCDRAGFSDCSRFIAVFKQKFGMTPLQYRKQAL